MKRKLLFTGIGLVTIVLSVLLFYLFINGLNAGGNFFLFLGSVVSIGVAVFSFVKATSQKNPSSDLSTIPVKEDSANSRLVKNSALINDFNKTEKTKDQLRLLELSGAAEKVDES